MQLIDRSQAEHYVWGNICDGWHFLKRDDISIISERVPSGASEVRHIHESARQFFYILSGQATIEANGEHVKLTEGQGLEISPGTPHQFKNESTQDVHFLVISHPSTKGDRINL